MRKLLLGSAVALAGLATISCSDDVTGPLGPPLGAEEETGVSHLTRQEAELDGLDRPEVPGPYRRLGWLDDDRDDAHWKRPEQVAPDPRGAPDAHWQRPEQVAPDPRGAGEAWQARPELPVDGGPREGAVPVLRERIVEADRDG